ncbi:MAG: carbohydrate-binding protein [Methylobacter sp.]
MRKIMINQAAETTPYSDLDFLDIEHLAQVEFTSECPEHPVESALLLTDNPGEGWQAAASGEQTIRLVFDQPCAINRIFLLFDEPQQSRTQEFVLLWLRGNESTYREILRQQYHFSPPDTIREIENYEVRLDQVKVLELKIIPDISGSQACARLKQFRLA